MSDAVDRIAKYINTLENRVGELRNENTVLRKALEAAYKEFQRIEPGCTCHLCRQIQEALQDVSGVKKTH